MATSPRFFTDCVDFDAGENFASNFPYPTSAEPESYSFASGPESYGAHAGPDDEPTNVEAVAPAKLEDNVYGAYDNHAGLDAGPDSTPTAINSSTTPNTQASAKTASSSLSNVDPQPTRPQRTRRQHHNGSPTTKEAPPSPRAKKKPGRKSNRPKSSGMEEEAKRTKFLERNRIAASKCRQKKKEWVTGLQDKRESLERQHAQLQMEFNGLLGEMSGLKEELMTHSQCHDPKINQWLENEARKFVQVESEKISSSHRCRESHESRRQSTISSGHHSGIEGPAGYPNIDPMLRSSRGSSAAPEQAPEEGMSFSPTTTRDPAFEEASATMFASGQ